MNAVRSLKPEGGYVVTEKGKLDLLTAETCQCDPKLAGLLLVCPECGTVFGSMRDVAFRSGGWNGKRS